MPLPRNARFPWEITLAELVEGLDDPAQVEQWKRIFAGTFTPWEHRYCWAHAHQHQFPGKIDVWADVPEGRTEILPFDPLSDMGRLTHRLHGQIPCQDIVLVDRSDQVYVPATLACSGYTGMRVSAENTAQFHLAHEALVRAALASGQEVPERVLAQYPGLKENVVKPSQDPRPDHAMTRSERLHFHRGMYLWMQRSLSKKTAAERMAWWEGKNPFERIGAPLPFPLASLTLVADPGSVKARRDSWSAAWGKVTLATFDRLKRRFLGFSDKYVAGLGFITLDRFADSNDAGLLEDYLSTYLPELLPHAPESRGVYYSVKLRPTARILHWWGTVNQETGAPTDPPQWLQEMRSWLGLKLVHDWGRKRKVACLDKFTVDDVLRDPLGTEVSFLFERLVFGYAKAFGYDGVELEESIELLNPAAIESMEEVPSGHVVSSRRRIQKEMADGLQHPDDVLIERLLKLPDLPAVRRHSSDVDRIVALIKRALNSTTATLLEWATVGVQVIELCRLMLLALAKLGRAAGVLEGRVCARIADKFVLPGPAVEGLTLPDHLRGWPLPQAELTLVWSSQKPSGYPGEGETSEQVLGQLRTSADKIAEVASVMKIEDFAVNRIADEMNQMVSSLALLMVCQEVVWQKGARTIFAYRNLAWGS